MRGYLSFLLLTAFGFSLADQAQAKGANDTDIMNIASAVNFDGRFEVFAVAVDGGLYHRNQEPASEDWSDWELLAAGSYSEVGAVRAGDGRLVVVAIDGGEIVIRIQAAPNGGWPTAEFRAGHDLVHLAVTTNSDGSLAIVATSSDGSAYAMHSVATADSSAASWSAWEHLGGTKLRKIVAERDGDGLVNVAVLDLFGHALVIQQQNQDPSSGWTDWQDLTGTTLGTRDVALARGAGKVLWLFAATASGNHEPDGLYGRALVPLNPASPTPLIGSEVPAAPTEPMNPRSETPPQKKNPRSEVPPAKGESIEIEAGSARGGVPPPPRASWSDWKRILTQGVLGGEHITFAGGSFPVLLLGIAAASGDRVEIAGNNDASGILHLTQNEDGSWPSGWEALPGFALVQQFASVTIDLGHAAGKIGPMTRAARVFVTAKDGTVATLGRTAKDAIDSLPGQDWRSLGRIPGPAAPDLLFQANQCLDTLVDSPADVRLGITTGVPLELGKALAGTPIEKAIDDVNALSQCEPHGETMGLWLDHQAFRPTLPPVDIVPAQKTFGLLVPIATLQQVFGTLWKGLPKRLNWDGKPDPGGNIELDDYSVELIEPNQLAFTLHGKSIADVPFSATATATFRVENEVPTCDVAVRVDASEPGLAGVASIVLAQFTAPLMGKLEEGVEKAQRKIVNQATAVCQLSKALISELYLAKPKDASKPRLVLEVKYEDIRVSAPRGQQGLFGFGLTPPTTHVRTPSVKVVVVPIPLGAGSTKIAVSYQLETHDLKGPLTVTWTPGNIQPLDSVTYTSGLTPVAIFTYSIPSRPPPYFLGRINAVVTDTDGFSAEAHKEIVLTAADLP